MSKGVTVKVVKDSISPSSFFNGNYVATVTHSDGTRASARGHMRERAIEKALEKLADKLATKRVK